MNHVHVFYYRPEVTKCTKCSAYIIESLDLKEFTERKIRFWLPFIEKGKQHPIEELEVVFETHS